MGRRSEMLPGPRFSTQLRRAGAASVAGFAPRFEVACGECRGRIRRGRRGLRWNRRGAKSRSGLRLSDYKLSAVEGFSVAAGRTAFHAAQAHEGLKGWRLKPFPALLRWEGFHKIAELCLA